MKGQKINIQELPIFSNLIKEYVAQAPSLDALYTYKMSLEALDKSASEKELNFENNDIFLKVVEYNYDNLYSLSVKEIENINFLKKGSMVVTTAHQPNLFLGPLYTITKAISTIKLTQQYNAHFPEKTPLVPVFIVGSEDHDKEELLHCQLFEKKYTWDTPQSGSVGDMIVDDTLVALVDEFTNTFGAEEEAKILKNIYTTAYHKGNTLAKAYAYILRELLGIYGLIVLDMNLPEVKQAMISLFERELTEQFAQNTLALNIEFLSKNYSVQASPMPYNLFEIEAGERNRIDTVDSNRIERLHQNPENFSPNVILRPLMQQMIVPNTAYIGGAAEVAYWLELKPLFDAMQLHFPMILMRDSISPLDEKSWGLWTSQGLDIADFFLNDDDFSKKIVLADNSFEVVFQNSIAAVEAQFAILESTINTIDKSLITTMNAEKSKLVKSLQTLLQKTIKAEKRNNETHINRLLKIKAKVIEHNTLLERKESFIFYYLKNGNSWIDKMIEIANPMSGELTIQVI